MAIFLSIEIDNTYIKITEVYKKGEILSVLRCITDNIHCLKDGKITDIDFVAKRIKEILNNNDIKNRNAVFLINSHRIMVRTIKLPLLKKDKEILSMLKIELQQIITADLNNYQIIYEISDIVSENNIQCAEYIVYCVPVDLVNQYIKLSKEINIKLLKIEILPSCINALYKRNIKINNCQLNKDEVTALVCINENISFLVANNGFCNFYIYAEYEEKYIENVAEPRSEYSRENNSEEKRSLIFLIAKFIRNYYSVGNKKINKIFIYGEKASEIEEEIINKLNIDAEVIRDISNVKIKDIEIEKSEIKGSKIIDTELKDYKIKNTTNKYTNTILSALNYKRTFNLKNPKNYIKPAVVSVIILLVLAVTFKFINTQITIRNKISAMSTFIDYYDNNEEYKEIINIIGETDYIEMYLKHGEALKNEIKGNDYVSSDILREIFISKPKETKIRSIYSDKDSTQLQCISSSMSEVSLFAANLRRAEIVESIYIPSIQSKTEEGFSYSVILKIKDVKENEKQ